MANKDQELKNKIVPELEKLLKEKRDTLRSLRFDLAGGKVKNINSIKIAKREIARILTFLKIREEK